MYKRYVMFTCTLIVLLLIAVAGLTIYEDPWFQYRDPFGEQPFEDMPYRLFYDATHQNPGMAKNFSYDTIIAGSSMAQNFDSAYFDHIFECNSLKLTLSGGTFRNIVSIIEMAAKHNPDLKKVYTSLDWFALSDTNTEGNQSEAYLLNDNYFDDVNYVLNKEVLVDYTLTNLTRRATGRFATTPKNRIFQWYGSAYGPEKVLGQYSRPKATSWRSDPDDMAELVKQNLNSTWLPVIEANPQIEFVFFSPPYSMLFWDSLIRQGRQDAVVSAYQQAYQELLSYDNVRVFDFHNIEEIVTNLWNYKDSGHYHWRVNDYMTECFADGQYELTLETVDQAIDTFNMLISNYDYDAYFDEGLGSVQTLIEYLPILSDERYAILISIGAESLVNLPDEMIEQLSFNMEVDDCKYFVTSIQGDVTQSYTISETNSSLSIGMAGHEWSVADIPISEDENVFSICMEGVEYSQNLTDLSFIVYDLQTDCVVDSVAFDSLTFQANRLNAWCDLPKYRESLRKSLVVKLP